MTVSPIEQFSFGVTYSPSYQEKVNWGYPGTTENDIAPVYFPAKVNAGVELKLLDKRLILDLDYRFANTGRMKILKDRHNINFGVQYSIIPSFILRTGFFTSFDYRTNDKGANFIDPIGDYDQYFITLGGTYKTNGLAINLSFINSSMVTNPEVSGTRITATLACDMDFRKNGKK